MHLDKRLSLIASMVRHNSRLADIGTDHAYLPVWLIKQGICSHAIATDINRGPISRAAEAISNANLNDKINVRLGNGLQPISSEEVDDIVITGMGGETIATILADAPWTKHIDINLVLQPMTKAEFLREFLFKNGFALSEEHIAVEGKHIYIVLSAHFDPKTAAIQSSDPAVNYRGILDPVEGHVYHQKQKKRLERVAAALRKTGDITKASRLEHIASQL